MRWVIGLLLAASCTGGDGGGDGDTGQGQVVEGCRSGEGPSERVVLVSHPFATDDTQWEVLALDPAGVLSQSGVSVPLGRATHGAMAFVPDGSIGLTALEDGGLGVVEVSGGVVRVLHSGPWGDLYVGAVAVHPSGERALLLDGNWRKNGGAVVEVAIDCASGALSELRRWPSKLAYAAWPLGASEWLVASDDVSDSVPGDLHRVGGASTSTVSLFPDEDAIISTMARTGDLVLLGDFAAFGGGNRIGVGRLVEEGLEAVSVVEGIEDPVGIGIAPSGRSAIASSGFGDALVALSIDPGASPPVRLLGEIPYEGTRPALPGSVQVVESLSLALVAENVGVRRLAFGEDGSITDLGTFTLGTGVDVVVGAIGVQP